MTDDGLIQKHAVRRAVGGVLFNVSNFPERAQSKLWGANMGPLNEKITDAVIAALAEAHTPTDDERGQQFVTDADLDRFEAIATPMYQSTSEAAGASKYLVSDLCQWIVRLVAEVRRLRRSDVPEPSARLATSAEQELGEAHDGERYTGDDQVADRRHDEKHGRILAEEVASQGEPSDAQVPLHVAIRAVDAALRSYDYQQSRQGAAETAVAALRAASEVPEPNGNHQVCDRRLGCVRGELREAGQLSEPRSAPRPGVLHVKGESGTLCGVQKPSHVTDGSRYADCAECLAVLRTSEVGGEGR